MVLKYIRAKERSSCDVSRNTYGMWAKLDCPVRRIPFISGMIVGAE